MSWAADVAFGEFAGQFDFAFSSAQHFRSRHQAASTAAMMDIMTAVTRAMRR